MGPRFTGWAMAAALLLPAAGCDGTSSTPRLNVLLITLDTTRADRLGLYGYERPTSPNLDRLAGESTVFDLAIAQAAVTPVSHASILTGLEPYNHGLRAMHGFVSSRLESEQETLAEVWRRAGGRTAAFVSAFPVGEAFGLHQGFDHFDAEFPQSDGEGLFLDDGTLNTAASQRVGRETTDAAIAWLDAGNRADRPLMMWVHYFDPHDALLRPPLPAPGDPLFRAFAPPSRQAADVLRTLYDWEIRYMDDQIGRLLEAFKRRGLWERTIVVVVADHGEGLGDHGWWSHGILYQEQIRVPLVVRVPGRGEGTRVGSLVRTIDLMPTVLEAAGVEPSAWPPMDGRTLAEALDDGRLSKPRTAYAESLNMLTYVRPDDTDRADDKNDKLYCLMDSGSKLIYHQLRPMESELFDLAADPGERHNLALSGGRAAMEEWVEGLRRRKALSDLMPEATPEDTERARRLKSLGYAQ